MTIQFRSRIKSTFDYGAELKKTGKCCFSNQTSESITFLECFNRGGQYFQDQNATCPSISPLGSCCSCSYLTQSQKSEVLANLPYKTDANGVPTNGFFDRLDFGIRTNITQCECDRIGGTWKLGDPDATLCRKQTSTLVNGFSISFRTDSRIPSACCGFILDGNHPIGVTCSNVCNARDCANLAIANQSGTDPYVDTVFTQYRICNGVSVINSSNFQLPGVTCSSSPVTSQMTSFTEAFANESFGPCFELLQDGNNYSYDCSLTTSFQCNGYWIDPAKDGEEVVYCNHPTAPRVPSYSNGYLNTIKYTKNEFNLLGLSVGDEFQGGIYIGNFVPKKTNSTNFSSVYGALNFSQPQSHYPTVSDESKYKEWAIIVNKTFLNTYLIDSNDLITDYSSSYYDGFMNFYGEPDVANSINSATIRTIAGKNRNGFIDYYVPSIVEMMFFAEQLKKNQYLSSLFEFLNIYCSSTFFTDKYSNKNPTGKNTFNGIPFLYGLDFSEGNNFGKASITGINTDVRLMLFRRIVII